MTVLIVLNQKKNFISYDIVNMECHFSLNLGIVCKKVSTGRQTTGDIITFVSHNDFKACTSSQRAI